MALARALATDPEVVLLDEPTSALDPVTTSVIEDLALALAAAGTLVVWVTHDRAQRDRLARHLVTVVDGQVVHEGERP
jgi:ABC-type phosphate transport system ATPase subunit